MGIRTVADAPGIEMVEVVIEAGATPSSAVIDITPNSIVGFAFPNTVSTAASFEAEHPDGTTYSELKDPEGNTLALAIPAAGGMIAVNPFDILPLRRFKLKLNGTEVADQTIVIFVRPIL